jgi:ankyrin repeat protein
MEEKRFSSQDEDELDEELDEDHPYFAREERNKSFEELINDAIEQEENLRRPYIEALSSLLESGEQFDINERDSEYGCTILMKLAEIGNLDLVRVLVDTGADVNARSNSDGFALKSAAYSGWQEVYDYLAPLTNIELRSDAEAVLPKGLLLRQRLNNYALTAFTTAAVFGNNQAISQGIASGIDINGISDSGSTALHKACWRGYTSIVEILLKAGADPNIAEDDSQKLTPLMQALALPPFKAEICQMLIKAGADINARNYENLTVLMMAVIDEDVEAVKLLIEAGVDINARDYQGISALELIKEIPADMRSERSDEIVELLLAAAARYEAQTKSRQEKFSGRNS